MKTKPTSLRFDENDLVLGINKSGIKKTQKLMDFLLAEYVREFKPQFVQLPKDLLSIKNVSIVKSDGSTEELKLKAIPPKKGDPIKIITPHPAWKQGDPKEGSGAFYLKYDCFTYEELKNKKQ